MRIGTPGFSGNRLREARESRSLSAIALSEIAGVSAQAVYQYENNRRSPSPDVLEKIATAANFPTTFFLLPDRQELDSPIFYRSMSAATKSARNRAEHRFTWLQDIVEYAIDFVALPEVNFPRFDLPEDPMMLSDNEIEQAAEETRRYWRMNDGPIANMVLLLENQGAVIARDKFDTATLDSLSRAVGQDSRPFVIIGTDKGSPARWRFDVAHELAHMVLHSRVPKETLNRQELHSKIERQAHRFARAFLLPLAAFGDDLFGVNLDAFRSLKPKWNVSVAAMIFRARDAGLVSEETERKLRIAISRRKWGIVEPYDDTTEIEEPRLLRRSLELILEHDQTPADIASRICLPSSDIETLSGLPSGYLAGYSRVTRLPDRAHTFTDEDRQEADRAPVIDLSRRRNRALALIGGLPSATLVDLRVVQHPAPARPRPAGGRRARRAARAAPARPRPVGVSNL